ncbi:hypothetical protein Tco_0415124 [Tanacetum coccineum]
MSLEALIADEDEWIRKLKDQAKRPQGKHDSDDETMMLMKALQLDQTGQKPRESDVIGQTNTSFTSTGWQITDTRDTGADSSMHRSDPESEHSEQSSDDLSKQDERNDSDMEDTENAHIPKVSTTTWFKPIPEVREHTTPEPEMDNSHE